MSYTNQYGQPQGFAILDTNKLREILIAEIIAINSYTEHIENSNMEDVNTVWASILEDEKKHYGIILTLLRKYDPNQYNGFKEHVNDKAGQKSPMQTFTPSFDKQIILNNIREDIKAEFEAIILYEQQLVNISYNEIRNALYLIINDEKAHTENLTHLLLRYDLDKYHGLK